MRRRANVSVGSLKRSDLGLRVLASGMVSLRSLLAEQVAPLTSQVTRLRLILSRSSIVIAKRRTLRIFVDDGPDDLVISARSQTIYAKRLAKLQVCRSVQIFYGRFRLQRPTVCSASTPNRCELRQGMADDAIVASIQKKTARNAPRRRRPAIARHRRHKPRVKLNEAQCQEARYGALGACEGPRFLRAVLALHVGGSKDEAEIYFHGDLGDPRNRSGRSVLPRRE